MRKLTDNQANFLLENFFKNDNYAGWKNIAIKLIEQGECIVAGTNCIWNGGIGNFIEVSSVADLCECSKYVFDLNLFLSSAYFKDVSNYRIGVLQMKKDKANKEYYDMINL